MDQQPPANLPMHDEPLASGALPPVAPVAPIQAMPAASASGPDDMFSGVEQSPVAPVPMRTMPSMPPATPPIAPASPSMLSGLPEAQHPPILHYLLIAVGVVVVLGLIAGGVWFFAIRRPTRQVMETLPAAVSTTTDPVLSDVSASTTLPDESIAATDPFSNPEVMPSKPVVSPPDGVNLPPPTVIEPNVFTTTSAPEPVVTAPAEDQDGDGLSDARETELGTSTSMTDTDGDGLSDGDEVLKYRTNPLVQDTDGDSYPDGVEVQKGFNPLGAGQCASPTCTF